jgi:putative RecB family exonuclease
MELSELRKMPHLSASSLIEYLQCGISYKFSRIEKLPPEFVPDALEFGTSIHRVLADFHLARKLGTYIPITELHARFEKYWSDAAKDNEMIRYKEGKDYQILLAEGKEMLSVYASSQPDTGFKVIAVEEPFVFELPGLPVPIIGAIDLIEEDSEGVLIVVDHKTAGKSYSIDDVNNNMQMAVYQIAMRNNGFANRDILLRFDCLIKTKVPKFEFYYTTRDEADEKRTIKTIMHAYEGIKNNVFLPNMEAWKCSGCSYQKTCDEYMRR